MQDHATPRTIEPQSLKDEPPKPSEAKSRKESLQSADPPYYEVREGRLYHCESVKETCIANFSMRVAAEHVRMDEDEQVGRDFQVELDLNGRTIPISVPSDDFHSSRLVTHIAAAAGSEAIIYSSVKDLRIAAQELSPKPVPLKTITTSMGFTVQGAYLAPGMEISSKGIDDAPRVDLDLSEGNFSRHLGFGRPDDTQLQALLQHLHSDFLQLKGHEVTYPLMGHIVLAAFASRIGLMGWQKPVMHLQGPSGSGKTFLGNLAASFYGSFNDRPLPWTSTPNAIELEGFYFRDALFLIDDFKASIVDSAKVTRIIQNSANSQGRARMSVGGGGYRLAPTYGVRGLILSTGEDFISDVESVAGRTILIRVEPNQNIDAGSACWQRKGEYRMLMPGLLQWLLSRTDWMDRLQKNVSEITEALRPGVAAVSNGTRVASNWALNACGFEMFVDYSLHVGVITVEQRLIALAEYNKLMTEHISAHADRLQLEEPSEIFFRVLSEKFATGVIRVKGLPGQSRGKLIGRLRDRGNIVCLFPDATLEVINSHFRSLGRRLPFTKETLREALMRADLLIRSGTGRVTHQIRVDGSRLQAWQFDANQFSRRCGMTKRRAHSASR